jgi:hypothetical protein
MAKSGTSNLQIDRSPIDQQWIQEYCDQFLKIANEYPTGAFKDSMLRRVECAMDLVEAWQKRKWPKA